MRIITTCLTFCCLAVLVQSTDEQHKKKKEKRQLDYSQRAQQPPYPAPLNFRSERRLTNYPQPSPVQYYPGPSRPPYRNKGRPQHYFPAPPPYAVQMEPLIHYSQRDPLYDTTNTLLSPDTDPSNDVVVGGDPVDRGGSGGGDTIYIPHKPLIKVVEKPVYIKEPEPIIEIIIKESNVSLPSPPTEAPPPPQKKKKEEVQVFYVKYKKNPHGHGKDAVIYDKPIPAISPAIRDDEPEGGEQWNEPPAYGVTEPPRPSTTLRTIIKPDSEVYHSPGNSIKVTFGKEGFDYGKRSSKPEDYPGTPSSQHQEHPRARQLSSFSDVYFKRPANGYFSASSNEYRSEVRPPQAYRPFSNFPPPPSTNQHNSRPLNREYSNSRPPPFFPPPPSQSQSSRSSFPSFSHSVAHPPPPQFQSPAPPPRYSLFPEASPPNQRKPVPYTPFERVRPSPPLPLHEPRQPFNPSIINHPAQQPSAHHQTPPAVQGIQFRPETRFNVQQPQLQHQPSFAEVTNQFKMVEQQNTIHQQAPQTHHHQQYQEDLRTAQKGISANGGLLPHHQQQQQQLQTNQYQDHFRTTQKGIPPSGELLHHHQQQTNQYHDGLHNLRTAHHQQQTNQHQEDLRTTQKGIPEGGELLHSLPRFEQHLVVNPTTGQSLPVEESKQDFSGIPLQLPLQQEQGRANQQATTSHVVNQNSVPQYLQQEFGQKNQYQIKTRPSPRPVLSTYSTTTQRPTTTTKEPEKPSTTTKDPKILEAQLPDEVPDDLRQHLLSSGILNNADISILDYDKVGDIPLSALPPEQLANFYSAGGAQQIAAASEPRPQVAALTARKDEVLGVQDQEMSAEESEITEVAVQQPNEGGVEMKVVKYNPETDRGQRVQEAYISDTAKQVDPVVLNDNTYNRYLPLKINGTQFPIPDVPELRGKLISSVVVLAPVSYDFSSASRSTREAGNSPADDIELIQNEPLKKLLANPSKENYKRFLENEGHTNVSKQSVILLVAGATEKSGQDKEIYMYDIATKTVSKLSGELSSAFVDAAEANSSDSATSEDTLKEGRTNVSTRNSPSSGTETSRTS